MCHSSFISLPQESKAPEAQKQAVSMRKILTRVYVTAHSWRATVPRFEIFHKLIVVILINM